MTRCKRDMWKTDDELEAEENRLRDVVLELGDAQRKEYYRRSKKNLKDPDTYATLNWFLILGLHHLYLGKWVHAGINMTAFALGVILLFGGGYATAVGIILLVAFSVMELWELFRSQIIVRRYNIEITKRILDNLGNR